MVAHGPSSLMGRRKKFETGTLSGMKVFGLWNWYAFGFEIFEIANFEAEILVAVRVGEGEEEEVASSICVEVVLVQMWNWMIYQDEN